MKLLTSFVVAALPLACTGALAAGCGSSQPRPAAHWDDTPSQTVTVTPPPGSDAGVDGGVAPGLAIFQRSCTPCHRRAGGDPYATTTNVFLETDQDFARWAAADSIGNTSSSLAELLSMRADGFDLIVGHNRSIMPPRASPYPAITSDEARTALAWLRSPR